MQPTVAGSAPASAQSFSHSGYAPPTAVSAHSGSSHSSSSGWSHNNAGSYHRHHAASGGEYYPYPYLYAVPFPYAADQGDADDSSDDDADYQGGPTVFDRRGLGAASYIPPTYDGPAHAQDASSGQASANESAADQAPQAPTNPTTLVFKNGRQIEVSNYAIVSQTLYDLTPGHHRKIALADLDLPATQQLNDDRRGRFPAAVFARGELMMRKALISATGAIPRSLLLLLATVAPFPLAQAQRAGAPSHSSAAHSHSLRG